MREAGQPKLIAILPKLDSGLYMPRCRSIKLAGVLKAVSDDMHTRGPTLNGCIDLRLSL
jgi:hypothetical protein